MEHLRGWLHPPVFGRPRRWTYGVPHRRADHTGCCRTPKDEVLVEVAPTIPGTLTVATTLPAPGFWEGDDVTIVGGGYEWGLARALADEFDLDLKIIDVPFADLVAGELDGADMAMAQIEITEERLEVLDFSLPYYASDFGVLMLAGESLRDLDAARALRWTVVEGARQEAFINDTIRPEGPVRVVADDVAAAEAITSGDGRCGADRPVERADPGPRRRSTRGRRQGRHRRRVLGRAAEGVGQPRKGRRRAARLPARRHLEQPRRDVAAPTLFDIARRRARDRNALISQRSSAASDE